MEKIIHKEDVVEFKNFLTDEEADALVAYYDSADELWDLTCFFNARVMDPIAPMAKNVYPEINIEYFNSLRGRLQEAAESVFNKRVRNLSFSSHKWLKGAYANDHSDNSELDGTPNAWRENKLVTILYLNDNYDGGHLTFRDHGISIAPKRGTLIVFDVGINNVHAVTEVTSGERYTMLSSWDFEDSIYPEGYFEEKEREMLAQQEIQQKQRLEWQSREGSIF